MQVEFSIQNSVLDLTSLLGSLNLAQTPVVSQDLQQHAAQVAASAIPLEQAQQQDVADVKGHLAVLVGGQEALKKQLAAASQELRVEWAKAASQLQYAAAA